MNAQKKKSYSQQKEEEIEDSKCFWAIPERYTLGKTLGAGAYGKVSRRHTHTPMQTDTSLSREYVEDTLSSCETYLHTFTPPSPSSLPPLSSNTHTHPRCEGRSHCPRARAARPQDDDTASTSSGEFTSSSRKGTELPTSSIFTKQSCYSSRCTMPTHTHTGAESSSSVHGLVTSSVKCKDPLTIRRTHRGVPIDKWIEVKIIANCPKVCGTA